METKRIDYMDISKGIAMLCIVAGHMGINSITRIVFTFHVPLFFLISGYFFHDKAGLIRKRSSQLLKPYFFTVVALCLCEVFKTLLKFLLGRSNTDDFLYALEKWGWATLYGSGSRIDFFNLQIEPIGAVWFLLALLWSTVLLVIAIRVLSKIQTNWKGIFLLACGIAVFEISIISAKYIWLPSSIQAGLAGLIFMISGYLYRAGKDKITRAGIKWILVASIFLWSWSLYLSFSNDNMSLVKCQFPNPIINITGAIGGGFTIICLSKWIDKFKKLKMPLKYIGRYSLIAMSIHVIESNFMPWHLLDKIGLCHYAEIILIFTMKLAVIYASIFFVNKIPILKRYFI